MIWYLLIFALLGLAVRGMYLKTRRMYARETMADIRGMMDSVKADLMDAGLDAEEVERFLEERRRAE